MVNTKIKSNFNNIKNHFKKNRHKRKIQAQAQATTSDRHKRQAQAITAYINNL